MKVKSIAECSPSCVKRLLKYRQNKDFKTNDSLMKVESIAEHFRVFS